MKMMEVKERCEVITALSDWFKSQNIDMLNALIITMELHATLMGTCAPNLEELMKGLAASRKDSDEIAVRSFLEYRRSK